MVWTPRELIWLAEPTTHHDSYDDELLVALDVLITIGSKILWSVNDSVTLFHLNNHFSVCFRQSLGQYYSIIHDQNNGTQENIPKYSKDSSQLNKFHRKQEKCN